MIYVCLIIIIILLIIIILCFAVIGERCDEIIYTLKDIVDRKEEE